MTAPAARQERVPIPILKQEKVAEYASIFERTGAQNGLLQGKTYYMKPYRYLRLTFTLQVTLPGNISSDLVYLPNFWSRYGIWPILNNKEHLE
jgi:hypothetical protein